MAKQGSFSRRFPHAKLFLFLAVLIALPLTVWSAQLRTNTEQHAAAITCGPGNKNPSCPSHYSCSYTGGNPNFGGTCVLSSLAAPTGLKAVGHCEYRASAPNIANYTLTWNPVKGADKYKIHIYYYYVSGGQRQQPYLNYLSTNPRRVIGLSLPHDTKYVYWQIRGYNASKNITGPLTEEGITLNCR